MNFPQNTYNPDYAIHPGAYLEEIIESRELKQREIADRMGVTDTYLSKLIHGEKPVGPDTALKLERVLGVSSQIWTNLNSNYRLFEAREKEKELFLKRKQWVKEFPLSWMKKYSFIPDIKDNERIIESVLEFFGISSAETWDSYYGKQAVLYRKSESFITNLKANATWLRASELKAQLIETKIFDAEVFKNNLIKIKNMTTSEPTDFFPMMRKLCQDSGVALVIMPEPPKVHVYGATKWLTPNKAMISLSLRRKSDDQFWFSFFHEAAHILLHSKKEIFIDDDNMGNRKEEDEADMFASDTLLSKTEYSSFVKKGFFYKDNIQVFSKINNIAAGILVGRLQHDTYLDVKFHNDLKTRYDFNSFI